ncbi:site-specific integrase [Eshraghiella crossota]
MAKAGRGQTRRNSKRRVLRPGESVRADGKYQYKYHIDGKPHFVYSWKLEPTDKLPKGKKPCLSLRELEKQVNTDLDLLINIVDGQMTVCELVDRYLKTKTGVRQSTKQGYVTVQRLLAKESFGQKTIRSVKTSDAKLFLIKLQQEDGKKYSSIHTMPNITSHVCLHTYCSNMAKSGMNPKTMQYLMGHSDISVTMNVYTHIGFDYAEEELKRMEEFRRAQAEIEQKKEKPMSQKMFKVI